MSPPATITVNRRSIESIIEELIEFIDTADRVAAIDEEKAEQDCEA